MLVSGKKGETLIGIFIFTLAGAAMVFDLKTGKIPNALSILGMMTGIAYSFLEYGVPGIIRSGEGLGMAFAILFLLFAVNGIGGGDVKLFMAIGTFAGTEVLKIIGLSFVVAFFEGIICVMSKLYRRYRKKEKIRIWGNTRMYFSVPICVGVMIYNLGYCSGLIGV